MHTDVGNSQTLVHSLYMHGVVIVDTPSLSYVLFILDWAEAFEASANKPFYLYRTC